LAIFFVGFASRFVLNYYLDINVFADFTSIISIIYYLNMSCIIVYINNMDLNFNVLKHISLDGITYDNILNAIKLMIDNNDRSKMTMNWEGYSLNNNDKGSKIGSVMFMNNPQGGNQQGGNYQGGNQQGINDQGGYTGPSRYSGGEPMDITELSAADKRRLFIYLAKIRDGEDGSARLNRSRMPNLSNILNEIENKSGPEISYSISKQLCKVIYTSGGQFDSKMNNGYVVWSRIGTGPDSEIMYLLRGSYAGGCMH